MTSLFETQVQKEPRAVGDVPTNPQPKVHQRTAELSTDAYGGAPSSLVLAGQMKVGKHRRKDMWKEVRAGLELPLEWPVDWPLDGPTH